MPGAPLEKASRKLRAATLAVGLWWLGAPVPAAGASLTVGATVVPYARLESAEVPGSVNITAADVSQGWVRASVPLSLAVRTNSREGYRVNFRFVGAFVTGARLADGSQDWELEPGNPTLVRGSDGPTREVLELEVRLTLAPDAVPGVYYWPLEVESVAAAGAR